MVFHRVKKKIFITTMQAEPQVMGCSEIIVLLNRKGRTFKVKPPEARITLVASTILLHRPLTVPTLRHYHLM